MREADPPLLHDPFPEKPGPDIRHAEAHHETGDWRQKTHKQEPLDRQLFTRSVLRERECVIVQSLVLHPANGNDLVAGSQPRNCRVRTDIPQKWRAS